MDKIITEDEQKAAVKTLERLISVPSYNQPAEEGAPFGKGIRNALDEMMKICDELSFKTSEDGITHKLIIVSIILTIIIWVVKYFWEIITRL